MTYVILTLGLLNETLEMPQRRIGRESQMAMATSSTTANVPAASRFQPAGFTETPICRPWLSPRPQTYSRSCEVAQHPAISLGHHVTPRRRLGVRSGNPAPVGVDRNTASDRSSRNPGEMPAAVDADQCEQAAPRRSCNEYQNWRWLMYRTACGLALALAAERQFCENSSGKITKSMWTPSKRDMIRLPPDDWI